MKNPNLPIKNWTKLNTAWLIISLVIAAAFLSLLYAVGIFAFSVIIGFCATVVAFVWACVTVMTDES